MKTPLLALGNDFLFLLVTLSQEILALSLALIKWHKYFFSFRSLSDELE